MEGALKLLAGSIALFLIVLLVTLETALLTWLVMLLFGMLKIEFDIGMAPGFLTLFPIIFIFTILYTLFKKGD